MRSHEPVIVIDTAINTTTENATDAAAITIGRKEN